MSNIVVVDRIGSERLIQAREGLSLMESLRDSGVDEIPALCGGSCACATCHVYVDHAWFERLEAPAGSETDLLGTSSHRRPNSRLSCQIEITSALDGLRVTIAPEE